MSLAIYKQKKSVGM